MSNTPGVTVRKDSTDVVDILGSVKEPAVQTRTRPVIFPASRPLDLRQTDTMNVLKTS